MDSPSSHTTESLSPASSSDSIAFAKSAADLKGVKNLSPLLTEPKVPLGTLVVMVKDGALASKPKGYDAAMFKLCVGITMEGREALTSAGSSISHTWNEVFDFAVTEYASDMEISTWQSTLDLLTNVESFVKSAITHQRITLAELEKKPNTFVDWNVQLGKKGKPSATVNGAVKFKPSPNSFVGMEKMLLSENRILLNTMMSLPQGEVSNSAAAEALNYFFTYTGQMEMLLKLCIQREVESADSPATLLRGTTLAVEVISQFVQLHGSGYLLSIIAPLVRPLLQKPPDVELDPSKMPKPKEEKERKKTEKTLAELCEKFLKKIIASHSDLPAPIRQLCQWISEVVEKRFPGKTNLALGGVLFLRFICPAIVAPENSGAFNSASEVPPAIRRGLILVAKTLQNLVNEVQFGEKEAYMTGMNSFLTSNQKKFAEYYKKLLTDKYVAPSTEMYLRRVPEWVYKEIYDWLSARKDQIIARLTPEEVNTFTECLTKTTFKSPIRQPSKLSLQGIADSLDRVPSSASDGSPSPHSPDRSSPENSNSRAGDRLSPTTDSSKSVTKDALSPTHADRKPSTPKSKDSPSSAKKV